MVKVGLASRPQYSASDRRVLKVEVAGGALSPAAGHLALGGNLFGAIVGAPDEFINLLFTNHAPCRIAAKAIKDPSITVSLTWTVAADADAGLSVGTGEQHIVSPVTIAQWRESPDQMTVGHLRSDLILQRSSFPKVAVCVNTSLRQRRPNDRFRELFRSCT